MKSNLQMDGRIGRELVASLGNVGLISGWYSCKPAKRFLVLGYIAGLVLAGYSLWMKID